MFDLFRRNTKRTNKEEILGNTLQYVKELQEEVAQLKRIKVATTQGNFPAKKDSSFKYPEIPKSFEPSQQEMMTLFKQLARNVYSMWDSTKGCVSFFLGSNPIRMLYAGQLMEELAPKLGVECELVSVFARERYYMLCKPDPLLQQTFSNRGFDLYQKAVEQKVPIDPSLHQKLNIYGSMNGVRSSFLLLLGKVDEAVDLVAKVAPYVRGLNNSGAMMAAQMGRFLFGFSSIGI